MINNEVKIYKGDISKLGDTCFKYSCFSYKKIIINNNEFEFYINPDELLGMVDTAKLLMCSINKLKEDMKSCENENEYSKLHTAHILGTKFGKASPYESEC